MMDLRFWRRKKAYQTVFRGPQANVVLADLRRFCRATDNAIDINNDRTTYLLAGRREVWLRIQSYLNLTDDQINQLTEDPINE